MVVGGATAASSTAPSACVLSVALDWMVFDVVVVVLWDADFVSPCECCVVMEWYNTAVWWNQVCANVYVIYLFIYFCVRFELIQDFVFAAAKRDYVKGLFHFL